MSNDGSGGAAGASPPFIIYSLPRSRSFWLSRYLTYGSWICGHDEILYGRSLQDVADWFSQPCVGTCETGAAPFWRLAPSNAKVVTIRRSVEDVMASLLATGVPFNESMLRKQMIKLDYKLGQIETRVPGAVSVTYNDLSNPDCCAWLFEHCLSLPFDKIWWEQTASLNLQISLPAALRYAAAYSKQLERFADQAKSHILRGFLRIFSKDELAGMKYSVEDFQSAFPDIPPLLEANCVAAGLSAKAYLDMDLDLVEQLNKEGSLLIFTARLNGRLFGYLLCLFSRSIAGKNLISAMGSSFYVSPSCPGTGRKLETFAVNHCAKLGAGEFFFRAGMRAEGPRIGKLYERLGAKQDSTLYRMNLQGM